jgi:hypothetical protein
MHHSEEKQQLEMEQKDELDRFNEHWDTEFYKMTNKFQDLEKALKDQHEEELNNFVENFDKNYREMPKPSAELINLNKTLELYVKAKE